MLKIIAAERILELVTTVSRAESIVGDLLEETSNRNTPRFWYNLLRVFTSLIGHDIRDRWLRLLLRSLWAIIELIILMGLFGAGIYILQICITGMLGLFGMRVRPVDIRSPISDWIIVIVFQFLIGWRIARRSDGYELPSACAFVAIMLGLSLAFQTAMTRSVFATIVSIIEFALPVITGAIMFRSRSNARYRKMQLQK